MKTLTMLTVFILLSLTLPAQHTWYWYNPTPDGNHLNDVWFTSAGNGWAVGNAGKLLHYDGVKWTSYEHLTFENLNGIWFTDEYHGWAVGNNGVILKFANETWTQDYSGNTKNLRDVCFTGINNGWAVGDVRMHYDGSQWTTLDTIGYGGLTEVFFTDANHGWCGGFDKFYQYDTTGWHWFPLVSNDIISVNSLCFSDPQHGWIGGYYSDGNNYIMEYNGSGWNWSATHPPLTSEALYFDNPSHGWSCGGQTNWYNTDTTVYEFVGNQWRGSYPSLGVPTSLAAVNASELYVVTQYGHILRHDTAGWDYSNTLAEGSIEISFPDTSHGWAVGNGKNILKYENGVWSADTACNGLAFQHIHFADNTHGIASGWSAATQKTAIYRYSGNGWQLVTNTLSGQVRAVCALPDGKAWLAGQSSLGGMAYNLTGNTLTSYAITGLSDVTSISFPDATHGWAIGRKTSSLLTRIIRYDNGFWTDEFTAPSNQVLTSLSFSTQNSGWAVGNTWDFTGISYHFNGQTWSAGPGAAGSLRTVHHPDPGHAWAVSGNAIYTLQNNVWNQEPLNTGQNLISLSFPSPETGWVGGEHGGILSSRSPFPVAIAEQSDNRQTDNLILFPNPATSEFIVTIPTELLNQKQLTLRLYNSRGELIHNEPVITAGGKITMNVEAYATGLYQVSLGNGKNWYTGKVVIE